MDSLHRLVGFNKCQAIKWLLGSRRNPRLPPHNCRTSDLSIVDSLSNADDGGARRREMHYLLTYFLVALAAYALLVLALYILSSQVPGAGFYGRVLASFACLIACAWYGVVASAGLRLIGYGGLSQWTVARSFKWTMRYATGVEFVVQGEEHLKTRPAVFIGNHQTCAILVPSDQSACSLTTRTASSTSLL